MSEAYAMIETPILDLETESREGAFTPEEDPGIYETLDGNRKEAPVNGEHQDHANNIISVPDTELDSDVSHLPETKTVWPEGEDSDDPIDINMWTQHKSYSSPSDQPGNSFQSRSASFPPANHMSEQVLYNADSWTRSESPDSVQEIPFASANRPGSKLGRQTSAQNLSSETITIPPNHKNDLSRSLIQSIKLIEGWEQLHKLPTSIYHQLDTFCRLKKTSQPDIIKTRWPPPNSVFQSRTGARTWFEVPTNGHVLLVARYLYGRIGQFIVVKDELKNFNGGKPAIIVHSGTVVQGEKNGITCSFYRWDVWDPFGDFEPNLWVNKVIEQASNTKAGIVDTVSKSRSKSNLASNFSDKSPANLQASFSPKADMFNASTGSKRPPPTEQPLSQLKRSRTSGTMTIDSSLLKAEYPRSESCGVRRDISTGEILLRRKSDGKLIALRCPECNQDRSVNTQQGFLNHMRKAHGRRYIDHHEMSEECGIVITNALPIPLRSDTKNQPSPIPTRTQPPRNATQRLATPPKSVGLSEPAEEHDEDSEPCFIFKKSKNDRDPRIRPLSSINNAEKLFVNALVAGVAHKNTLMLTITIEDDEPIHIVKNDKEDFENVLDQITNSSIAHPKIFVTAEDLDE